MKNVNIPPFWRPWSISVLSCVASVIGCPGKEAVKWM